MKQKKYTLFLSNELHAILEQKAIERRNKEGKGQASIQAIITDHLNQKFLPKKKPVAA